MLATQGKGKANTRTGRGRFRILVMDGSEHIRTVLSQLLTFSGHVVAIAAEGGAALNLFRQALADGDPFDAVILDLSVVHGLDAMATVGLMQSLDANVKVIVSSAFFCGPSNVYKQHGFVEVLPKPFTNRELQSVMERALTNERS